MKTGYKAGDAMTKKPISVSSTTSLKKCCEIMKENKVGSLVVKEMDNLKGIITSEKIIEAIASKKDVSIIKASDIMIKNIPVVPPEMDIYDILVRMGELDIRQIPVKNNNKLVGLITMKDILKIEPMLFEIIASRLDIREEDDKLLNRKRTCDICGDYS
jgi:CBS domain-containing protein